MAREPETRDLMFQDEIKDTVRRAYGAIETGGGEGVARRLYSEEELAASPPSTAAPEVGSTRSSRPVGWATKVRRSGSTSSSRCWNALEPMPRNPASRAGQSSSGGRWRTSPARAG